MTKSTILHTPQDHDFQHLIAELRQAGQDGAADSLMLEVAREWQQGSSTVMKRSRYLRAQTQLVQTIDALRRGEKVKASGYKLELAQSVADALEGRHVEPVSQDDVEAALRAGSWIILGFENGKFSANADDEEVEAGSWGEALTQLASKLSEKKRQRTSGEYHYTKRR